MNVNDVLMSSSAVRLVPSMRTDAKERVLETLIAAVMAAEAPALIVGLRKALEVERAGLPALEQRLAEATAENERQLAAIADLENRIASIDRDSPAARQRHRDLSTARDTARHARQAAETSINFAKNGLRDKRADCQSIEEKIAALEALPAPDAAVLSAIRGGAS